MYVDGVAASMASLIAMAGDTVIMPENAFMMIHKPWGISGGDAEKMRTYAERLDKLESVMVPVYAQKTGKLPMKLPPCWRMRPGCPVPSVWHTDLQTR